MTPTQLLQGARATIEDEDHWTTGSFATDKDGFPVGLDSREACKFCGLGAAYKQAPLYDPAMAPATNALSSACRTLFPGVGSLSNVNDSLGHRAVLQVYDEAIRSLT